jgi:hypothetical protein
VPRLHTLPADDASAVPQARAAADHRALGDYTVRSDEDRIIHNRIAYPRAGPDDTSATQDGATDAGPRADDRTLTDHAAAQHPRVPLHAASGAQQHRSLDHGARVDPDIRPRPDLGSPRERRQADPHSAL